MAKWKRSDRPWDSEHMEAGNCSVRVMPTLPIYSRETWEWSLWVGPLGKRTLHAIGHVGSRAGAKRIARQKLAACPTGLGRRRRRSR